MKYFLSFIFFSIILWACSTNKITGRKQLSLVTNEQLISIADTQYRQVLSTNKILKVGKDAQLVKEIGSKIAAAVSQYYTQQGMADLLKDYKWEYNLIDSKEVNAWCMPGGKIAVYTGILPVTQTTEGLAVVMGHEIAHALAEHGKERVNQQLMAQGGALTLQLFMLEKPQMTQDIFLSAFGAASNLGFLLPFSRKQELEADKLGILFAARAGYDPRAAIPLWQRMEKLHQGEAPPEFTSTHPAEATRIKVLEQQMPEAIKEYENSKLK